MLAVTGANGHLGQRLLERASGPVRALVRSERAAGRLHGLATSAALEVRIVDYRDDRALTAALDGCDQAVHLVGIIKEGADNTYHDAHEATCAALAEAAATAGIQRIVHLSILGAAAHSTNACLASRAAAERLLLEGPVPVTVIRVPMVLGEDDYASRALARRARQRFGLLLRGSSLEQPIYAGDVVAALLAAIEPACGDSRVLDLAGPESLTRSALTRRAARVLGRRTRMLSLPVGLGLALAAVFEQTMANPPVTRAMLGVLDHDDAIDPGPAAAALGLNLTPLDEALRRCLGAP